MASMGGNPATSAQYAALVEFCKAFVAQVRSVIDGETKAWVLGF
jgi:hypothetical protein